MLPSETFPCPFCFEPVAETSPNPRLSDFIKYSNSDSQSKIFIVSFLLTLYISILIAVDLCCFILRQMPVFDVSVTTTDSTTIFCFLLFYPKIQMMFLLTHLNFKHLFPLFEIDNFLVEPVFSCYFHNLHFLPLLFVLSPENTFKVVGARHPNFYEYAFTFQNRFVQRSVDKLKICQSSADRTNKVTKLSNHHRQKQINRIQSQNLELKFRRKFRF